MTSFVTNNGSLILRNGQLLVGDPSCCCCQSSDRAEYDGCFCFLDESLSAPGEDAAIACAQLACDTYWPVGSVAPGGQCMGKIITGCEPSISGGYGGGCFYADALIYCCGDQQPTTTSGPAE
jgi:hypothetical protein